MRRFLIPLLLLLPVAAQAQYGPEDSARGSVVRANTPDQVLTGGGLTPTQCAMGRGIALAACIPASGSTVTVDCGLGPLQTLENNAAFTLAAPVNDGSCDIQVYNGASAGAITFSGWNVGTNTGDTYATTSGNHTTLFVRRLTDTTASRASYFWSLTQ